MPTSNLGSVHRAAVAKIHLAHCSSWDPALTSRIFTVGWSTSQPPGSPTEVNAGHHCQELAVNSCFTAGNSTWHSAQVRQKAKITSCTGGKGCYACCSLIFLHWLGWQHFWESLICKRGCQSPPPQWSGGPHSSASTSGLLSPGNGTDRLCSSLWFTPEECLVDIPTEPADCGCCSHSQQSEDSCFSR